MTSNAGLIFSLCAGILIGLKLFCNIQKSDKQKKNKEKDREEGLKHKQVEETSECFRTQKEVEELKKHLDIQLALEKARKYQNDARIDELLEVSREAVRKEKIRGFCRDLWYGTSIKNGMDTKEMTDDGFEDLLKDPTTLFYEANDPIEGYKVMVQSRGKKFIFAPEARIQNEPRDLYSNAFMGSEIFDLKDGYVIQHNGKPYIYHNGRLEELEVYTNP